MTDTKDLIEKYNLVTSNEWKEIRRRMLDYIVTLGNSATEPLMIQGMLNIIGKIDNWEIEFLREKELRSREK